jgi:Cu/Zn superoxide dismutase
MIRFGRSVSALGCLVLATASTAAGVSATGAEGSAFIIHANQDDQVTDATNGGRGARIACAVIHAD